MENEAASVKDVQWARETQHVVLQGKRRKLLTDTLASLSAALVLAALWMTGLVLVSRFAWHMDANLLGAWSSVNPVTFDLLFLGLILLTGLFLGWRGVPPGRVAVALALLPVLLWLIGLSVHSEGVWTEPGTNVATDQTIDFAVFTLDATRLNFAAGAAFVGFLSAWAGRTLRRRSPSAALK
ncbi:hypothetical protein [Deinococcus frigens]|uniref:hypothetical protein n=1 Tax=Deinococcus frigens TaxID=249403 RepID=UPI000497FBEA|nr:hypothetical protein [Deinococcus frigens]